MPNCFGWNWTGVSPRKKKPKGLLKISKIPTDYSLIDFHTRQHSIKPRINQFFSSDQYGSPASSKMNLQSLLTSLEINKSFDLSWKPYQRPYHDFPVNFQNNYCASKLWWKNTANQIASLFLLHRLLNNAMSIERLSQPSATVASFVCVALFVNSAEKPFLFSVKE